MIKLNFIFTFLVFLILSIHSIMLQDRIKFLESQIGTKQQSAQLNERVTRIDAYLGFINPVNIKVKDSLSMKDE